MSFKDLADSCQAMAIANKIDPTADSVWRSLCRYYSNKFHTPLDQVLDMSPEHVILNVYEDQIDDIDVEEKLDVIMEAIYTLEDPDYESKKSEELDEFIKQAELDEQDRVATGRKIHAKKKKSIKKALLESIPPDAEKQPTGGSINLSYLEAEENGRFED